MKTSSLLLIFFLMGTLLLASCNQKAPQEPDPVRRKSPIAIAKVKHADTYVKIVYGQPYKKGREIFGSLEPYGEVWRTGANEATEITTTRDILIAGNRVEAGTYSLFSIPGQETWTIILNSELGQWGAFEYDATKDVMRIDIEPHRTEQTTEAFTIQFEEIEGDSTSMVLKWDQTQIRIPFEFLSEGADGP